MPDFVHLHNHSEYSLLDGAASLERLVDRAKSLRMSHLALTDHGNMFGTLKFYQLCKKRGITPIIGCEFYMSPVSRHVKTGSEAGNKYYHLVLLAKDQVGYKNLIKLSSFSYTEGFYYKPRIDQELLERYREGLICTSACIAGEIPTLVIQKNETEAAKKAGYFQELFGKGNYFLELQDHGIPDQKIANRGILKIAQRLNIPTIVTNDLHYVDREDANAQDIIVCIGTGKKKSDVNRLHFESQEFYMKSAEEMAKIFSEVPDALLRTKEVAEKCNLTIPLPGPELPDYQIPPEFNSPEEYLRYLAYEGLKQRYSSINEDLRNRLDYELETIIKMCFTGYFLIVWDFIHSARQRGIPVGPGRGSGAGSLVAYSLRITDIDPLKYGLLFERFLNPERISMPDFDIDFCYERRQEVIAYVTEKYGKDRVGQIITFGTLKAKAVLKDVARVLNIPFAKSNEIAKWIPEGPKVALAKSIQEEENLRKLYGGEDQIYRELLETSLKLEGLSRHASTHAAGIVIGKNTLTEYVPLYRDPKTGSISTQFTMEELEACGLVKMDFLGLKTLTLIENTVKLIHNRFPQFDIERIPENNAETFQLLGEGRSACVFQFESQGMQSILKRVKPTSIPELIALNALYRPGPMQYIDQFIDAKWGRVPVRYPLPELEPILKETYGVIVYQEQVMEIARIVAGYTLGQADILRRAMSKKKQEEMAKQKESFIKGAMARGYSAKKADEIFELLIPFAGYGFNKSHAAAYSVLAYKTAYLKANFPAEFMAANLTNEINDTDKLAEYIEETRKLGIEILPLDINHSEKLFSVIEGKILYGLLGMKNMGTNAADEIHRARFSGGAFTSFLDFLDRIDLKIINRKVLETGIQCGLFDTLHSNRATLLVNLDAMVAHAEKKKESRGFGQTSLFGGSKEEFSEPMFEESPDWPENEKLRFEREILGFYFTGHPLDRYRERWEQSVTLDLRHPKRAKTDTMHCLLGLIRNVRILPTKKGDKMAFALLEDFSGSIELVVFSAVLEHYNHLLQEDAIVGAIGRLDLSREERPSFIVKELKNPNSLEKKKVFEVHVLLSETLYQEEDFYQLRSFIIEHPGECTVFLHFRNSKNGGLEQIVRASPQLKINGKKAILQKLQVLSGVEDLWVS